MARVIGAFEEVTVLPWASWTRMTGWVPKALAAEPPEGWDWKTSLVAVLVEMVKVFEVVEARPEELAAKVYPDPALSMERPEKVATPFTAATVVVPESAPEAGLVAMARVIEALEAVTVLPWASWTVMTGWVVRAAPAAAPEGWVEKTSFAGTPVEMLNALEVAVVSVPELAARVYPEPVLSIERPEKVATPFTALTVADPPRAPVPGLLAMARVTGAEEEVMVLPCASCTRTTGWMAQTAAADPPEGWVWKASWVAVAVVTVMVVLVETAEPPMVAPKVTEPATLPVNAEV